jgi:hypothetical protein
MLSAVRAWEVFAKGAGYGEEVTSLPPRPWSVGESASFGQRRVQTGDALCMVNHLRPGGYFLQLYSPPAKSVLVGRCQHVCVRP